MSAVFDQPTLWQRVRPMFGGFDAMLGFVAALLAVAGLITMYSAGFDHGTRFVDHALKNLLANIDIENSVHRDVYRARIEGMKTGGKSFFKLEPSAVSKRLIHALESPRPRRQYYVTTPTYIAAIFKRIMPPFAGEYFAKKF